MRKYKIILFLIVLLNGLSIQAQDLMTNYLSYVHNFYNLNPAYCAIGHKFAGILDIRQKSGLNNVNTMLGVSAMLNNNQGAGGRLITDIRGPFQVMILDGTYAYKLGIDKQQSIYFGLSAGLVNKSINTSKIKNYDQLDADDPVLNSSNFRSTTFTAGGGLIYEFKSFEFAVSAPQLISENKKSFSYFNVLAANIFYLNAQYEITPILIYFNTPVLKNLVSLQCKAEYSRKLSLQLGYQTNSTFNACIGFTHSDIGVAYNFMTANKLMNVQTSGTHEVILTLRMGRQNKNHHLNKLHPQMEHIE